jgi:hypothetical protein
VFNIFLQILDDGRLTDSQGRTVDFRNAVIIMTSNIGSHFILEQAGTADWDAVEDHVLAELRRHFRPELLNRIDDIIVFRPLDHDSCSASSSCSWTGCAACWPSAASPWSSRRRPSGFIADAGYDPAFRRPTAQARHPAAGAEPAGHGARSKASSTRAILSASTMTSTPARSASLARIRLDMDWQLADLQGCRPASIT